MVSFDRHLLTLTGCLCKYIGSPVRRGNFKLMEGVHELLVLRFYTTITQQIALVAQPHFPQQETIVRWHAATLHVLNTQCI